MLPIQRSRSLLTTTGCAYHDPDHTHEGGLIQYNGGKCDGFLRSGSTDLFPIGYYTQKDLPFLGRAAPYWTVCDRYFSPIMGSTEPNRLYLHTGMTDRIINSWAPSTLPTMGDRLAARRLRGAYDAGNLSFLSPHWGDKYDRITLSILTVPRRLQVGRSPERRVRGAGLRWERRPPEHRHPRGRVVPERRAHLAVTMRRAWRRTLLVVTFDEWGGFFDHESPPRAPDVDPAHALRGFRVPCLLISPFARRRYVAHGTYDHASILRLIEWRWHLEPLSVRDARAKNLAAALDFSSRDLRAPRYAVPRVAPGSPCAES